MRTDCTLVQYGLAGGRITRSREEREEEPGIDLSLTRRPLSRSSRLRVGLSLSFLACYAAEGRRLHCWFKNGEAFIFDHGAGDLEDLFQSRVAGELSPLCVELRYRIEFPELEVFLGITDDRSPDAPESKSMFSDQWKCALGKCAVIFRDMMSSEAVRDL